MVNLYADCSWTFLGEKQRITSIDVPLSEKHRHASKPILVTGPAEEPVIVVDEVEGPFTIVLIKDMKQTPWVLDSRV